ncbi:nucleoside triphosphate pyrophosphohydrolase [Salisediminibacterium halotolerans]|uniref:nucleoside triphosphate pyrophosphohydrolase n=1 Tax=Salisediminibacterium halotolerans TaxID=517425 RepID=UPI000EAD0CD6|nr:nucleoside triphosphate pyrophosphohydrolase [Salisediminibacterium halotolerans]RLJ72241.1 putative house-cleaning noncanonical NTP pyrophosphatase (MazG superfamily) [Actinophytocola xinjiangensis]RPE85454.1 putative house-cleaning noncanonical NTP pyrophosphatase (MazG superfamily) [Salisediminibacterium halotolerans]TWG33411.1 putative house-cleaning noncanonical NTP pyrophosphatase (MazG superfamily) [Salisediminibacterium halotolerans]GEL07867.1 phosphoribosyl-ATP pyrophosphohydrolase 
MSEDKEIYDKLVRDKIPEMINKTDKYALTHVADDEEMKEKLAAKLLEEFKEFKENPTADELADILEVIDGLAAVYQLDTADVQKAKAAKYAERGGFTNRIILDMVIDSTYE